MKRPIILASASPRRQALLRQIGVEFEVIPSNVSEDFDPALPPRRVARTLAELKGTMVSETRPEAIIIGADTIVVLDGEILGKPDSPRHAVQMLERLSGRTHQVVTGVAVICVERKIREVLDVTTDVTFGVLSRNLIERYVATGEPTDKAGAYGAQGRGAMFVESIRGSYSNVVGLPLYEVMELLRKHVSDVPWKGAAD